MVPLANTTDNLVQGMTQDRRPAERQRAQTKTEQFNDIIGASYAFRRSRLESQSWNSLNFIENDL
jgi:hypothetical protein